MLAYDRQMLGESTEHWMERQQNQALDKVRRQALRAETNKKQRARPDK